MKKYLLFLIIGIILAGGVYVLIKSVSKKYTGPAEKITIGVSDAVPELSALLYIADKNNYFENEGLDVVFKKELNGIVAQREVLTGQIDVATTPDFAIVSDSFEHDNFRILASIGKGDIIDILGRKDKNIKQPSDLKGKRIGYTPKSTSEFFLGRFLTFNNLALTDVTLVPLPFDKIPKALEDGEIDAAASINLFSHQIKQKMGENIVSWSAQVGQDVFWLLVSTEDFTKNRPQAVNKLLKAVSRAEEYLKKNPVEGRSIVSNHLQLDQSYFNEIWPRAKLSISLDQSLLLNMESEAEWVIANKLTDKVSTPYYRGYIYTDALKKIKREAVTIY